MMYDIAYEFVNTILQSLYAVFFPSVVYAILGMFVYMYAQEKGWRKIAEQWIDNFKHNKHFRIVLGFVFYTAMIAEKTLLGRSVWKNSMGDLLGFFWLYENKVEHLVENIENLVLFAPYMVFVFYLFGDRILKNRKHTLINILYKSSIIALIMSVGIEFCQFFFKLGKFQVSDICANTISGIIGGFAYWLIELIRDKKTKRERQDENDV